MKYDIERFERMAAKGLLVQGNWGDGREDSPACAMGALLGLRSEDQCVSAGWPLWLVEAVEFFNDASPKGEFVERTRRLVTAIAAADRRGVNWETVMCRWRMNSILPTALKAIGEGDEPWRVGCRNVVQMAIDLGGRITPELKTEAIGASWAAETAGAAVAAWASWAVAAAETAGAVVAAETAAVTEMFESLLNVIGEPK